MTDPSFLGEEFLTWLWYQRETGGGEFELGDRKVEVAIDDFLAFAPSDDETEQTLRKGLPTRTAEARSALRAGRRVRSAKLLVAAEDQHWSLVFDGPTFHLRSVRQGNEEDGETPRDRSVARMAGFVEVYEILAGVYACFLRDRLRPEYLATSGEEQARWMAGGSG